MSFRPQKPVDASEPLRYTGKHAAGPESALMRPGMRHRDAPLARIRNRAGG